MVDPLLTISEEFCVHLNEISIQTMYLRSIYYYSEIIFAVVAQFLH